MSSTNTKIISTRAPLDFYMEILQVSSNNSMSISDYVLQILYRSQKHPQEFSKGGEVNSNKENEELKSRIKDIQDRFVSLQSKYTSCAKELEEAKKGNIKDLDLLKQQNDAIKLMFQRVRLAGTPDLAYKKEIINILIRTLGIKE
jgi:hypothetical protein